MLVIVIQWLEFRLPYMKNFQSPNCLFSIINPIVHEIIPIRYGTYEMCKLKKTSQKFLLFFLTWYIIASQHFYYVFLYRSIWSSLDFQKVWNRMASLSQFFNSFRTTSMISFMKHAKHKQKVGLLRHTFWNSIIFHLWRWLLRLHYIFWVAFSYIFKNLFPE